MRQPPAWPVVNTRSLLHADQKVVARSHAFSLESSSASSKHFTFRERKCTLSENLSRPHEDPKSRVGKEQGLLDTDVSADFPLEARHPPGRQVEKHRHTVPSAGETQIPASFSSYCFLSFGHPGLSNLCIGIPLGLFLMYYYC